MSSFPSKVLAEEEEGDTMASDENSSLQAQATSFLKYFETIVSSWESDTSTEGCEKIPAEVPLSNMHDTAHKPDKVLPETEVSRVKEVTNRGTEEERIGDEMANLGAISDDVSPKKTCFAKCTASRRLNNAERSGGFENLNEAIGQSARTSHEVTKIPVETSARPAEGNKGHLIHVSQSENAIQAQKKTSIITTILQKDEDLEIDLFALDLFKPVKDLLKDLETAHQKTKCILDEMLNKYDLLNINFNAVRRLPIYDPLSRRILEDSGHSTTLVLGDILVLEAGQLMDGMEVSFGMWEVFRREFNAINEFLSQHNSICESFCYCDEVADIKIRILKLIKKMNKLGEYRNNKDLAIYTLDSKLQEYVLYIKNIIDLIILDHVERQDVNIHFKTRECPF